MRDNSNTLQATVERRLYNGLSLLTSFTWSKSIDNDSTDSDGYYDSYNPRLSRRRSDFDLRRNFSTSAVYELLRFRSSGFFKHTLVGGWTVGTIVSIHDGPPYTTMYSGDPSNTGTSSRANIVSGYNPELSSPTTQIFFNTNCFFAPPKPHLSVW